MTESFPLKWPLGRARTLSYQRKDAQFKTTRGRARDELLHELKLLGAKEVVISSNVATYRRGGQDIMYADQSAANNDPGVAVYYQWRGESYSLACDLWKTVDDNLQALNKTVNAIRGIERWGTGEMMKAAFAGFKELPPAKVTPKRSCWEVLGIKPTGFKEYIVARYRDLAKQHHPDAGGNKDTFQEINEAYQEALAYADRC